jgi:hypothetical protein
VVNISSVSGVLTTPFAGPYCASKAAFNAASDALRMELAPFGVKVVTVQPGGIQSAFGSNASNAVSLGPDSPYQAIKTRVLGRANESLVSVPEIFRVVGADRAVLEGRQALHLLIEDRSGQFSAFLVPGVAGVQGFDQEFSADYQVGVLFDQPCVAWSNGDSLVMITAARSAGELLQTADLLRSAEPLP